MIAFLACAAGSPLTPDQPLFVDVVIPQFAVVLLAHPAPPPTGHGFVASGWPPALVVAWFAFCALSVLSCDQPLIDRVSERGTRILMWNYDGSSGRHRQHLLLPRVRGRRFVGDLGPARPRPDRVPWASCGPCATAGCSGEAPRMRSHASPPSSAAATPGDGARDRLEFWYFLTAPRLAALAAMRRALAADGLCRKKLMHGARRAFRRGGALKNSDPHHSRPRGAYAPR